MKKTFLVLCIGAILSGCQTEPNPYATISGKISNAAEGAELTISNWEGYKKIITIEKDGTFQDTLKIEEGKYSFSDGNEYGTIYLKNGNYTSFTLDAESFDETLQFEGDDADKSNFMIKYLLLSHKYFTKEFIESAFSGSGSTKAFDSHFDDYSNAYEDLKASYTSLDANFISETDKDFDGQRKAITEKRNLRIAINTEFPKGTPSPEFNDYRNVEGGTLSLSDFKGSNVFIDVWATWCMPCIAEIPALKALEKDYHGKNIKFLGIAIDKEKDFDKWATMVADKELGGTQLFADNDFKSKFIEDYLIKTIPRFIILNENLEVVFADAHRPSDERLRAQLDALNL